MSDPSFPDDYYTTVDTFEAELDGWAFNAYHPEQRYFHCDWCSKGVEYQAEPRVAQYWCDRIPHDATAKAREINHKRRLAPMATYCEECSLRLLLFPCRGYTEVRTFATVTPDRVYEDLTISDISAADDGIPWPPASIFETLTDIPFDEYPKYAAKEVTMAPENIITWFLVATDGAVDIRELVRWDGSIDPTKLAEARHAHENYLREMATDRDRSAFRNRITDRRRNE